MHITDKITSYLSSSFNSTSRFWPTRPLQVSVAAAGKDIVQEAAEIIPATRCALTEPFLSSSPVARLPLMTHCPGMAGVQSGFGNYLEEEAGKEDRRRQTHMKEKRQEIVSDECNCEKVMKGR